MPAGPEVVPGPRGLILLVEDDGDIGQTISEVLEQEGYGVILARDGHQALDCLRGASQQPQVIVLDLMMPVMDGWEFRAEQRKIAASCTVPVLIVSADGNMRRNTDDIGAAGYLRKPFDIEELLDALARLCHTA